MQAETCEVIIYTQSGALSFEIIATSKEFEERLAEALEQGTVILDTTEGSKLVLCAVNVVAIEVREAASGENESESEYNTPPVEKI